MPVVKSDNLDYQFHIFTPLFLFGPIVFNRLWRSRDIRQRRTGNKSYMKVYVLKSLKNGNLYKGFSKSIAKRLKLHNSGHVKSTKNARPWELVYFEDVRDLVEARRREIFLKSGVGRKYLSDILSNTENVPVHGPIVQGIEQKFPKL